MFHSDWPASESRAGKFHFCELVDFVVVMQIPDVNLRFFRPATGRRKSDPASASSASEGKQVNLEEMMDFVKLTRSELNRLKQQKQEKLELKSKINGPSPIGVNIPTSRPGHDYHASSSTSQVNYE